MEANKIRQKFLDFFANQNHTVEASASLIPHNDKTLLFVNAGMVPFKDVYAGREKRDYTRAVSAQRCIRVGGKHNDLENVGYTARHHTFFEMLGNFSFGGDYFKKEAIGFTWQFLTKVLGIPAEKLWVSVHKNDDEAEKIWTDVIGFDKQRISRCGDKDNFWTMGDTGPCGPCSEVFYDHGSSIAGGPPGSDNQDGDRFVEIWNLVFTQFDKQADGELKPLAHPCVDTGMGLERLAAVLQEKHNNYDTDLFADIIKTIVALSDGATKENPSVRVIADHIRSTAFIIADGIVPGNEGRGYVLRRIIRRAVRHGYKLGINQVFFYQLVKPLAKQMAQAYPILLAQQEKIERILKQEETRFGQTLAQGMKILEENIKQLNGKMLSGAVVFKLYDTYGFPADLTADVAREKNLTIDLAGFDAQMAKQKKRARASGDFKAEQTMPVVDKASDFVGYHALTLATNISHIIVDGGFVSEISQGQSGVIVLSKTPFYPGGGGQVPDQGQLNHQGNVFNVLHCQKQPSGAIEHHGELFAGRFCVNDKLTASVDKVKRKQTAYNHSATHLLHAALRQVLGSSVEQKGSLVDSDKLRFDFCHQGAVSQAQLLKIEALVNEKICQNGAVDIQEMAMASAKKKGAMALFDEKYGKTVRVLTMGSDDFSIELCGGTHVKHLAEIALFKITDERAVGSGIRRIEALTSMRAYQHMQQSIQTLSQVSDLLKATEKDCLQKAKQLLEKQQKLNQALKDLQKQKQQNSDLSKAIIKIAGGALLVASFDNIAMPALRQILDDLKNKHKNTLIVLASVVEDKILLVAGVSGELTAQYPAQQILSEVAQQLGGKAGGRDDMAQGGGRDVKQLETVLSALKKRLS